MTKRRGARAIAAVLISTAMVLSFAACEAEEQPIQEPEEQPIQETDAECFTYSEEDGEIVIEKYIGFDKEVVIPAAIDGKPVTVIGNTSFYGRGIESVTIPDSVETIHYGAFVHCTALENVTFPDHAVKMGYDVFEDTPWLEKMRAENRLVIVNDTLIDGQTCLGDITIPDGVQWIAEDAFRDSPITSVTIPDSVTVISMGAFMKCYRLTSITIGSGVTAIEKSAFYHCRGLTEMTLPDGLQSLRWRVFEEDKLTVTYLGKDYTLPSDELDLYFAVNR